MGVGAIRHGPQPAGRNKRDGENVKTLRTAQQSPGDEKMAALRAAVSALAGDVEPVDGPTMNISAAAKRAGVARAMVYRAIAAGALRASPLYPGGRPRVREADFRDWVR